MQKQTDLPVNISVLPRCNARTRFGSYCPNFAGQNGRCRRHGGLSTGPKTQAGKAKARKGNWKHGEYSLESVLFRKLGVKTQQEAKAVLKEVMHSLVELQKDFKTNK